MSLSSSNRKYQPYPLSYFSVVVCLRCLLHHILSLIAYTFRENRDFVFIMIVQFMMSANSGIRFGLQILSVCFVHYTISLSSLCKLIWRHWTYKMPVRYILSSVWVRLSILSQLSVVHMGLCLPISLMMTERIYTSIQFQFKTVYCQVNTTNTCSTLPTNNSFSRQWGLDTCWCLSYYHHQIGNMNYNPLFRVRSWNNGMRCMSLYILI